MNSETCLVVNDLRGDVLRRTAQRVSPTLHFLGETEICHLPMHHHRTLQVDRPILGPKNADV